MRGSRAAVLMLTCAAAAAVSADYVRPAPQRIEVAKGIYLFISKPYGDVGLDGNAVAILSNDGVLVFDSNGTPASSAAVLDADPAAHRQAGEVRRELALALGSLVWDRDLHARVPGREGRRARENARDDGGAGDRVQSARASNRIFPATSRRSRKRSPPSRSSSRCWRRIASSSSRNRKRTWSCRGRRSPIGCRSALASAGSKSSTTTAPSRRAIRSCICRTRRS